MGPADMRDGRGATAPTLHCVDIPGALMAAMGTSVSYPEIIALDDGAEIRTDRDDQDDRNIVVEVGASVRGVREALERDGFEETRAEFRKPGQLGRGMVRRHGDWQAHVRLFRRGDYVQMDCEVEVSKEYVEHLTHGSIPAPLECLGLIRRHFGKVYLYHKKRHRDIVRVLREHPLELPDPESKTSVGKALGLAALGALGIGLAVYGARRG